MKRATMITLLSLLALAGCASSGKDHTASAFPEASRARPAGGTFVNLDNLRQYGDGMNKRQLYSLLGTPHFGEGMWGVKEWNYLFNLRPAPGQPAVQCQFRIQFDGSDTAIGHAWQPASCAALLEPPMSAAPAPAPPPAAPQPPFRLSADALFGFDSAVLSDRGRQAIAQALGTQSRPDLRLLVIGHTDRLGSDAYNRDLSQRRAQAVAGYLQELGVPAHAIRAEGRGSGEPLVQCDQRERQALVACLAPNRRVEIAGFAGS